MEKKRAVAYVRVSTASSAQIHSYDFQADYWNNVFKDNPEIELVDIYADKGISGSSIYKRPQFMHMMEDARKRKFDVIYTKSVSRFSRNVIQLIDTVRELRDIGIEVVFENENIHTFNMANELFLTIAATIAENDLKVDSERQKWSIRHRIENGWISIGSGMYGYKMTADNTLEIIPDEAEVIRKIFEMYIGGTGSILIARKLNEDGHTTFKNNPWTSKAVLGILSNEKYMGDTIMGKGVKINGKEYDNKNGEYGKKYYIQNSHESIVSKETFNKAAEIRAQRNKGKKEKGTVKRYPFTGKMVCGQCNSSYNHKINNCGKKWQTEIWMCKLQQQENTAACDCTRIKDSVLKEKFIECYNEFVVTKPAGQRIETIQSNITFLQNQERELMALHMQKLISENDYRMEKNELREKIKALQDEMAEQHEKNVHESDYTIISEFDEEKLNKFIKKVIINKNMVTFVFHNGVQISRKYTNGQPGNKKGWNKIGV